MLTEYLTGEEGGENDQLGAAKISRLIIAGNSLTAGALADTPSYAERKAVRTFLADLHLTNTDAGFHLEKAGTRPNNV
jgi:hypothetical protein